MCPHEDGRRQAAQQVDKSVGKEGSDSENTERESKMANAKRNGVNENKVI